MGIGSIVAPFFLMQPAWDKALPRATRRIPLRPEHAVS